MHSLNNADADERSEMQELQALTAERGSLCVGLDTDPSYLPESVIKSVGSATEAVLAYNKEIIRRIAADKSACCCKVQIAYYKSIGLEGIRQRTLNEGRLPQPTIEEPLKIEPSGLI